MPDLKMTDILCRNTLVVSGPRDLVAELVETVRGVVDGQPSAFVLAKAAPLPPHWADQFDHDEYCCFDTLLATWGCTAEVAPSEPPQVVERAGGTVEATFRFSTDWQPPFEALGTLASRFSQLAFDLAWQEPRYLDKRRVVEWRTAATTSL